MIKNILLIVFTLISSMVSAQNDTVFKQATEMYNQEHYQKAIDAYMSILDKGEASTALYYNLANAHYKISNIGQSIYYYEKALELSPDDKDVLNNLTFAENATIDAIDVIPQSIVSSTIDGFTTLFAIDGWAWLSVICIVLFVVLFMLYYNAYLTSRKRMFFISSWIVLAVGLFGVFFAFRQSAMFHNNQYAIIYAQETAIKSEPNLRSEEIFQLHEGTKVKITETVNDWKKIKLTDGKIGWIPASDLNEL